VLVVLAALVVLLVPLTMACQVTTQFLAQSLPQVVVVVVAVIESVSLVVQVVLAVQRRLVVQVIHLALRQVKATQVVQVQLIHHMQAVAVALRAELAVTQLTIHALVTVRMAQAILTAVRQ
jgi:hypothetical protein